MIAKMQDEVVVLHSRLTTETARFKAVISHQQQHAQVDFGAVIEPTQRRYGGDIEPISSQNGADMEPIWSRNEADTKPKWNRYKADTKPICGR